MACFGLASYGLPAIVTRDPFILSFGTLLGDSFTAIACLFLWFISIRAFLITWPMVKRFADYAAILLTVVCIAATIVKNLTLPYGASIITKTNGSISLVYTDSKFLTVLNAIDTFSLIVLGFYFMQQSRKASTKAQAIKIMSIAVSFFLTGLLFVALPFVSPELQADFTVIIFSTMFLLVIILTNIASFISKKTPTA